MKETEEGIIRAAGGAGPSPLEQLTGKTKGKRSKN